MSLSMKLEFAFFKTNISKCSSDKLSRLGELIMEAKENKRSTGADDGKGVLNLKAAIFKKGSLS